MQKPNVVEISAKIRSVGPQSANALRRDSEVPGIIYGPKLKANIAVAIGEVALEKVLTVANFEFVRLKLDNGETFDTIIKKVDFQPVTDRPIHIDFLAVDPKVSVDVILPIKLVGTAIGTTVGGRIVQPLRKLKVKGLPGNIPALVQANISKMRIDSKLRVRHIHIDNVTILDDGRKTIASLKPPRGGKAGLAAELFATPDEDLSISVNSPL